MNRCQHNVGHALCVHDAGLGPSYYHVAVVMFRKDSVAFRLANQEDNNSNEVEGLALLRPQRRSSNVIVHAFRLSLHLLEGEQLDSFLQPIRNIIKRRANMQQFNIPISRPISVACGLQILQPNTHAFSSNN